MKSISCIYIILNVKTRKVYIGQTANAQKRFWAHVKELKAGHHHNRHLQFAWDKYGENVFQFKILEYCPINQLDEREQHYLDIYTGQDLCYNLAKDATAPMRGLKHSEDTKRRIGISGSGRVAHNKGKPHSEETRARMRESHKNRYPITEETRLKLIESRKNRKPITEETRQRMSAAKKARPGTLHTEETKRKMSESAKHIWAERHKKELE